MQHISNESNHYYYINSRYLLLLTQVVKCSYTGSEMKINKEFLNDEIKSHLRSS